MVEGKKIARVAIVTAVLLLIPLVAMQFVEGWNWTFFDFVFAAVLIFGAGFFYEFIAEKGKNKLYKIGVAVAVVTGFGLLWANAAVGIIAEDHPVNLMYFGVVLIGIIGCFVVRFKPSGMARASFVTAAAQILVPIIALLFWKEQFVRDVLEIFAINIFFAVLWIFSGILFRKSVGNK